MQILHGTWIPVAQEDFLCAGKFYLWVETSQKSRSKGDRHPRHLTKPELAALLTTEFGIKPNGYRDDLTSEIESCYFLLPTADNVPLLSPEMSYYLEEELPETYDFDYWQVDCYPAIARHKVAPSQTTLINNVIPLLNDLHFIAHHNLSSIHLGEDLLFWFHFTQELKQIIFNDQYIPALKYREINDTLSKQSRKKSTKKESKTHFEMYGAWEYVGEAYQRLIENYVEYMPPVCAAGFMNPQGTKQVYEPQTLLSHFSEFLLNDLVTHTYITQGYQKSIQDSLIQFCLRGSGTKITWGSNGAIAFFQEWQTWRDRIVRDHQDQNFHLYFQLQDPVKPDGAWHLNFLIAPKNDPSYRVALSQLWPMKPKEQEEIKQQMGEKFTQNLLMNLGYAARIYPPLWQGLETDEPIGITLDLDGAFNFLKEAAWVLESANYKVIVPAWWTPQGRQRAKIKLKAKGSKSLGANDKSKSYFSFDKLVDYEYNLAIGTEQVSEAEWQKLVAAKTPLVKFRGQWLELDQSRMAQMLGFWQQQKQENPELSLLDFMKLTSSQSEEELEVDCDRHGALGEMLAQLSNPQNLEVADNPEQFVGSLREYQKRGLSWLQFLEQIGLNGCLADDMGLGKTIQVIARLVQEREESPDKIAPTLLIAPTSVLGNWLRELQKFAPHLQATIHHGGDRPKTAKDFKQVCREHDLIISSFGLVRKDIKLFNSINWHRIVLDEAQNIKNPKAALTKAILKLEATHRLALTGTPIENRLLDLWSIFNFLNPGYLGKQTQFRKSFEIPIQKDNNIRQSATLKKLVEPFILRRVKTDKAIIKDLPDKVEQKLYCNLTKEQASLYQVVVKDVEEQLKTVEGIKRKGLILGTLTRLKQICNHPRQFLQDNSEFAPERSHKLERLLEMTEEAIAEGESLLVFTQFTEIGAAIEKYFRQECNYQTYYLHGGTSRKKRETMIKEFQDPASNPAVFVLSLKAGGVGITLTKANHVFHFDRWWNPSVEDQATDRAFRIGQKKNVFVHKFVATGTLEERIDTMIEDKKKLAGSIVGSDESWLTELDNDAFRQLIALNQSAIME